MWHPKQRIDWRSPKWNSMSNPLNIGPHNVISSCMNHGPNVVSTNETLPAYALSGSPQPHVGQASEPHSWFYCLPHFRQAFTSASNSILKEKLPANTSGSCQVAVMPNAGSGCAQKKFLVFDHSGDQTTLIFSPGIGTSMQALNPWSPKPQSGYNMNEVPRTVNDDPLTGEFSDNRETDEQSEMQEDTEELNALLYSDDDSHYTEDDEITSTGHSPSSMTAHNKPNWFEGSEEVAIYAAPTKKRKLFEQGCDDIPSVMDTASSLNPNKSFEYEEDAESSCVNHKNGDSAEIGSISRNKRMRKERILESVSILQSIIPDAKDKGAIVVLDEAIQYLKSLKLKAKSLGLGVL